MIYLISITIFLVSIFLYLLIELKRSIHMIYIIPLTILFTGGTYFYLDSLYGYPTWKSDEKKFGLLSFQIDEEVDRIYLWVVLQGERLPKGLIIPYTEEKHQQLVHAKEAMSRGAQMIGEFGDDNPPQEGNENSEQMNEQNAGLGTIKSKGGSFSLIELKNEQALPRKNQ